MNYYSQKIYRPYFIKALLCFSIGVITLTSSLGQARYRTSTGNVHFNASTPLEDIDAENQEVNAILSAEDGRFAVVMLIKDFEFPRKLMQEHFNENYMETGTYPKAFFSGVIEDFDLKSLGATGLKKIVNGELSIHGVSLPRSEDIVLRKVGNAVFLESNFIVRPEDHNIEVPKIVFTKIAREVRVSIVLKLMEDKK